MSFEIISRKDAWTDGRKKFYTGRACKNGHLAQRYVRNNMCVDCLKTYSRGYCALPPLGVKPPFFMTVELREEDDKHKVQELVNKLNLERDLDWIAKNGMLK